jgi:hypothetical protein
LLCKTQFKRQASITAKLGFAVIEDQHAQDIIMQGKFL